jgi:uncharacterized protein YndB with AHSA1/START domain
MLKSGLILTGFLLLATPAAAEIKSVTPLGFEVSQEFTVRASPDQAYRLMVRPEQWWDSAHTWSGSAKNLSIDPRAGGCFCEQLPDTGAGAGSVQHMTVVSVRPSQMIRLKGALGPTQSEPLEGVLTISFKPDPAGTRVSLSYVMGGYFRMPAEKWAPMVEAMWAGQMTRYRNVVETGAAAAR